MGKKKRKKVLKESALLEMDGKGVNRDLRLVLGEAFWNEVKLTINGQMFRKIGKE